LTLKFEAVAEKIANNFRGLLSLPHLVGCQFTNISNNVIGWCCLFS